MKKLIVIESVNTTTWSIDDITNTTGFFNHVNTIDLAALHGHKSGQGALVVGYKIGCCPPLESQIQSIEQIAMDKRKLASDVSDKLIKANAEIVRMKNLIKEREQESWWRRLFKIHKTKLKS